jgi:hypothetical protein
MRNRTRFGLSQRSVSLGIAFTTVFTLISTIYLRSTALSKKESHEKLDADRNAEVRRPCFGIYITHTQMYVHRLLGV